MNLSGKHHLNGVDKPFWKSLPRVNIFEVLCPDLAGMGRPEYDARIHSQIRLAGDRSFLHGVSHISQMTGMEHRMLERTHLSIVANALSSAANAYRKLPPGVRGGIRRIYGKSAGLDREQNKEGKT